MPDYVTREAIADGYDSCAVTSVPAAEVEGAVLDHIQKLLAAPELVARTWATAKRANDAITQREVTVLLAALPPLGASYSPLSRRASSSCSWSRWWSGCTAWRSGFGSRGSPASSRTCAGARTEGVAA